jgi:uncharacterized ParB-like nuclease family protein
MTDGSKRALIRSILVTRRREGLDRNKVTRYRQALRRGDTFPPIWVIEIGRSRYEILDGFHRFHAHRREGRKTIAIEVRDRLRWRDRLRYHA